MSACVLQRSTRWMMRVTATRFAGPSKWLVLRTRVGETPTKTCCFFQSMEDLTHMLTRTVSRSALRAADLSRPLCATVDSADADTENLRSRATLACTSSRVSC